MALYISCACPVYYCAARRRVQYQCDRLLLLLSIAQLVSFRSATDADYLVPFMTLLPSVIMSRMLLKICHIRMLAEDDADVDCSESVQDDNIVQSHSPFLTTFMGSAGLPFSLGSISPVADEVTSRVERMA